jgi:hypothetical protein
MVAMVTVVVVGWCWYPVSNNNNHNNDAGATKVGMPVSPDTSHFPSMLNHDVPQQCLRLTAGAAVGGVDIFFLVFS